MYLAALTGAGLDVSLKDKLRNATAEFILAHPELYEGFLEPGETLHQRVELIRQPTTYGDAIELHAIGQVLQRTIVSVEGRDGTYDRKFEYPDSEAAIYVSHHFPESKFLCHYNAILPRKQVTTPSSESDNSSITTHIHMPKSSGSSIKLASLSSAGGFAPGKQQVRHNSEFNIFPHALFSTL